MGSKRSSGEALPRKLVATTLSCARGSLVWSADREQLDAREEHAYSSSSLVLLAAVSGGFVASRASSTGTPNTSCALAGILSVTVTKWQVEEEMTMSNLAESAGYSRPGSRGDSIVTENIDGHKSICVRNL